MLLALSTVLIAPATLAAERPTLEQGFRTCENLLSVPLAFDLLWTIPKEYVGPNSVTPTEFERRHRHVMEAGSFTTVPSHERGRMETARIRLVGQKFVRGLVPQALAALSCPEGCDIIAWTLEFGHLAPKAKFALTAWHHSLPPASEDETRPEIVEDTKGNVSLVCDLTL